jgi:predicted nucleic acid-binding protein
MSRYYVDASALVKRYVDETGSDWLQALLEPEQGGLVLISRLAIVEVISAFARRRRDGSLSADSFTALRDAFRGDCLRSYQVMPPTLAVVELACALLEHHPLRAYDAVHLATALSAERFFGAQGYASASLTFLSADDRLNRVAAVEGLSVDNPNQHP